MTPENFQKIDTIFNRAKKLSVRKRSIYLSRVCRADLRIRREVEELLAQHDRSTAFLGIFTSGASQKVSHYAIREHLGGGGMGFVFKAEDTRLDRFVAIKALPPWRAQLQEARDRLLQEAKLAAALNHPSIVTVYEVLQEEMGVFIVMEYLAGQTLRDLIPPRGLQAQQALGYGLHIADALDCAHADGILHGDLKPSNIFVTEDRRVKLLDFGLAVPLYSDRASHDAAGGLWGTRAYMAPEQLGGTSNDPRSEVFSFGLVLWEMFTGKHPFAARIRNVSESSWSLPKRRLARIPLAVESILRRCLEREPQRRFPSMRELNAALKDICGSTPISEGTISTESARHRSSELQKAKAAIGRMNYESFAQSRRAFEELGQLLKTSGSETVRAAIGNSMRDLILYVPEPKSGIVSPAVRETRRLALELLRLASRDNLLVYLQPDDLKYLDLWNMDFSRLKLTGFRFDRSFLIETSFEGSDLTHDAFTGAWIRNVNFTNADLAEVDFTDADWFNALGLTKKQLRSVRLETLMPCPATEVRLREYLDNAYDVSIGAWSDRVREQIIAAWTEYLQPHGLRDFVNLLHGHPENPV
jgi:serine/threonine protein kinase